ncbi:lytic murein transglycosylase [Sphingomonas sp. AP4-R1]|uniref:lytic murein transglycosylase n=1 Tax=Sphingomonas sp. AP4-R1 TaxID=2735134 RepID=UPI001493D9B2|nr:lytic murein transglycosylase [Sphingomonas sp. AP4-R1]QJU59555.1 lytic murein transglycosylase [Sphingomonas sp. AP4-R1]
MIARSLIAALSLLAVPAFAQEAPPPDSDQPTTAAEAPTAPAQPSEEEKAATAFRAFVTGLRPQALAAGVNPQTFDREVSDLTFDPRVIRADRGQPGGGATSPATPSISINFAPYRRTHVEPVRIGRGRSRYAGLRPQLSAIEAKTGVPESIMLAIYGHETGYGTFTGNYDILRSFATLAYEGRRRALFTTEFIDTLKLIDRGFPRSLLKGSWAGATGYPQFLPSVWLRLAVDGDGDGKADIWRSEPDALASIGNYLSNAGWKPNVPWGVPVVVPSSFDRTGIASPLTSPRCPRVHVRLSRWLTMAEWRAKGLMIAGAPVPADTEMATLIEPDGPGQTAYLLTTNYQAILDYNCSNFYALSVGLLADEVMRPAD